MSRFFRFSLPVMMATASIAATAAAPAQARPFRVTGQQTTITPSAQAAQFLSSHHVTVTATAPATLSNGTITLPIFGGRVSKSGHRGVLRHHGALTFSNGSRSLTFRHFVLRANAHRGRLLATVHGRRVAIAHLIDITRTISGKSGTISGELVLSRVAAHKLNRRFGKHTVHRGADLGTLTSSVTVS